MGEHHQQSISIFKPLASYLQSFLLVEVILAISFILLIILACCTKNNKIPITAIIIIFISSILVNQLYVKNLFKTPQVLIDTLYYDTISINFNFIILIAGCFTSLGVLFDNGLKKKYIPELFAVIILAGIGGCLLVSSYNLMMAIIAIETISIAIYLICTFFRSETNSITGTYKYLINNILLTLIFVYAISLLYGINDSIKLDESIYYLISNHSLSTYFIGACFISIVLFKLFIFPFSFIAPGIYKSASISGVAFLSTIPKIAFFGFLYRISTLLNIHGSTTIYVVLMVFAAITLIVGVYSALKQVNIKALLAYASLSDSGFLFYIIVLSTLQLKLIALDHVIYYLLVYVVSINGLCLVFSNIANNYSSYSITKYLGFFQKKPYLFAYLAGFIVSLVGLPPTAGFLAKFLLLINTISFKNSLYTYIFILLFVIYSVVSIVYYLRILSYMLKKADNLVYLDKKYADRTRHIICFILLIVIVVLLIYPFPQ